MKYVGSRYVPKFMGTYDATQIYEALCVVDNGLGTSYISQQIVPAGTPLTDTTYWAVYGASSGAIINLQDQIDELNDRTITGFDVLNDLLSEDLTAGTFAMTLGYGSVGDFGGCIYEISATAPASPYPYETLNNGLYAIPYELMYLEQIGAIHDGITDVLSFISVFNQNGIDINLAPGCSYYISDAVSLSNGVNFNGNGSMLRTGSGKAFNISGGYIKSEIKNIILKGGSQGEYAFVISKPHCIIDNIEYLNQDSHFISLTGSGANSAYDTTIKNCTYSHTTADVIDAVRIGVNIDIDGGLVNLIKNSFSVVTIGINIVKAANVNIENNNISNGNASIFPSQTICFGVKIAEGRNINIERNYIEDFECGVYASHADAENINIIDNFINLLSVGDYVIWLFSCKNVRVNGNYLKSTKSGSYGIYISPAGRYVIAEGNTYATTDKYNLGQYTEIIESGSSNLVEFGSTILDIRRHSVTHLATNSESISVGGYYDSPTVTFGGTQDLTVDIPSLHVVKFIAHTNMTVNITTGAGDTYTKALTRLGDCEITIFKHDNGLYSIS